MNDNTLAAQACAKVNLFLEVTGKRGDGYHDIDSVFLEIDLADSLTARADSDGRVTLLCDDPTLPVDEGNLALRAAVAVREYYERTRGAGVPCGLELRLAKRIPAGAGLGGGSSDAAAALRLADSVWGCGLGGEELHALAAGLGSDVAFFLRGGACRGRGRGEILEALPAFPAGVEIGLALPALHSSTAAAYRGLRLPAPGEARSAEAFIAAMAEGDIARLRACAFNRFEESVFREIPELGALHTELEAHLGHSVRMSGSGAGLWFFPEAGWRENAALAAWAREKAVRLLSCHAAR
jgi:4-diphosphocytidyl-2-C-methyl-D-erythritol kinase